MTSTLTVFIGLDSQVVAMPQVPVLWDLVEAAAHWFREALVLVWRLSRTRERWGFPVEVGAVVSLSLLGFSNLCG